MSDTWAERHILDPDADPSITDAYQPEAALEAARAPWGPEWPVHLSLTDAELEPEPEAGQ